MSRSRNASSIVGYGASVVVSALVTLISIPILIGAAGAGAWASLAVGQAVGTGAAILIGFGWGTTGPTLVARADEANRRNIYLDSFRARIVIAVPVLVLAILVVHFVVDTAQVESILNALGYGATGLLAGWYFTGVARPYLFLLLDTAPRVIGAAAGAIAVLAGAPLVAFPAVQLLGVLGGVALSTRFIAGPKSRVVSNFSWTRVFAALRGQSHGVILAVAGAAYSAVPLSLVAFVAPSALPSYALVDKLLRFATTAYAPIVQFLQGWVPTGGALAVRRKIPRAFGLGVGLAAVGAVAFVLLAPWLAGILSHSEVAVSRWLVAGFAVTLLFMVVSQITGLVCLLALDHSQRLALFTAVGIVIALPSIYLGALLGGAVGAAWMLALGEFVALAPQLALLALLLRKSPSRVTA